MKENKEKIEFWLHSNYKTALNKISQETGYSVSELMRRGVEYIIKDLMPSHFSNHGNNSVPFNSQNKEENNGQ